MSIDLVIISTYQNVIQLGSVGCKNPEITVFWKDGEKFIDTLEKGVYRYLTRLQVGLELSNICVLYSEHILFPINEKKTVINLLLSHFKFGYVEFIPNPLVITFGNKLSSAIVINIEDDCIIGIPVVDHKILDENICISTRSTRSISNDVETTLVKYIFGNTVEKEYDPKDLSICMMLRKMGKTLPIDIRNELLKNIILDGYRQSELIEYSLTVDTFFHIHYTLNQTLWSSAMMYGSHLLLVLNGTIDYDSKKRLDSDDWYQSNFARTSSSSSV